MGTKNAPQLYKKPLTSFHKSYQAQIRTIEQTNQLGSQADRNTASIVGAIANLQTNMTKEFCDVKEREMQEKINTQGNIITQLRGQIDNAQQTAAIMDTFGMSDDNIREALQVLLGTNTGMTVSRSDICMSAMFIGRATSREQYADTIAHEIDHVQSAVCDYYGIHQGSEVAAYLQGYLMRRIVEALEQ